MDNLELQRELDEQLRSLRIQLKLHENKVKSFETKAKEERKAKRRRDDFGTVDSQKRIKSEVSVPTKSEGDANNVKKTEEDDVPVENVKKESTEEEEYTGNAANAEGALAKEDAKTDNSGTKSGRPRRTVVPRDRRLFTSLLQGTLISFNRQSTDDKLLQKRKEVELQIEEKVASEQKKST